MSEPMWKIATEKMDFGTGIEPVPPDYGRLFRCLDSIGVHTVDDYDRFFSTSSDDELKGLPFSYEERHVVGDVVLQAARWLGRRGSSQVRLVSDLPTHEELNLLMLLSEEPVVLSSSSALRWSSDVGNPVHTQCWRGLLREMLSCRELLRERGGLIVAPATILRFVRDQGDVPQYRRDFASSLASPEHTILRSSSVVESTPLAELERLPQQGVKGSAGMATSLMKVRVPSLRGVEPALLRRVLSEEVESAGRLRFVLKGAMRELVSKGEGVTTTEVREMFERVDYEASRVELEYQSLLRKRRKSLGGAVLAATGLALSVALPAEYVVVAGAFAGGAFAQKTLDFVCSWRDSLPQLRENDYFVAWRAMYNKGRDD